MNTQIQNDKLAIIQWLDQVEDERVIDKIKLVMDQHAVLSDELKAAIEDALQSKTTPHAQVMEETKWRYPHPFNRL